MIKNIQLLFVLIISMFVISGCMLYQSSYEYDLADDACNEQCQDKYGTEGTCGGEIGDLQGTSYCEEDGVHCVCTPPTCTIDDDCTDYNTHFKCEDSMCVYPDCDIACTEVYGYSTGSCGIETGTEVGTAYCGHTMEQCMCS